MDRQAAERILRRLCANGRAWLAARAERKRGKRAVGYRGRVEGGSKVSRPARNLPRSEHRGVRPHFSGKGGYVHQVVPSPETLLCMHATDILHSNLHNILHTRQRAGPASASGSRIQPGRANEELRWQAPVLTRVPSGSNVSFGQICPHERLREAARLVAACTSRVRRLPARPRRHARCRGHFPGHPPDPRAPGRPHQEARCRRRLAL